MAALKTRLGRIPCPDAECGHTVALRENEAGTLTIQCDECDMSAFAKKGTDAARRWRARLPKEDVEPVKSDDPKQVPKAPEKPARTGGFSLNFGGAK